MAPEGDVGGDVVVGLDLDGDGKVDLPLPRAAVVPRKGTWTEDIEDRRQALWTAWSIAQMTQGRLLKHKEMVAALSWVAEIELALISFYEDSVPDPRVSWDLERRTRGDQRAAGAVAMGAGGAGEGVRWREGGNEVVGGRPDAEREGVVPEDGGRG